MTRVLVVLCALALLGGCSSTQANSDGVGPPQSDASPRFWPALAKIGRVRAALSGDLRADVRTEANELIELGVALLQARMPHNLARPDVRRYNAARQAFGEGLKDVTYARDANDMRAMDAALTRLEGATRRWSDAHLGRPPETDL